MIEFILALLAAFQVFFRSRRDLALEILALRQQVAVLKRKYPKPRLRVRDRIFWVVLRRFWSQWKVVLVIVKPDTVVGWHRAGFRLVLAIAFPPTLGQTRISEEIRDLIRRLALENPTWGAPKNHGELLILGFEISERTVARYLRVIRSRGDPSQSWLTFLHNHHEVIVVLDFVTVPTITFQRLYGLFVIEHGRRRILHFNIRPAIG